MFKIVLLSLALTGLQALPISRRLTKTHHNLPTRVEDGFPADFRQGTEPSRRFIVDLNTGLVQDHISEMERRTGLLSPSLGNGHGEMDRRHWLTDYTAEEVPVQKNGGGWVRVEGRATLPDGFRQGTEPSFSIPSGFRQGTEPTNPKAYREAALSLKGKRVNTLPDGFRQGTEPTNPLDHKDAALYFRAGPAEPYNRIVEGFRPGTGPFMPVRDGFRQGTEPSLRIPDGFRQGTEPSNRIPDGFRQGTERFMPLPDGFRQGTEPSLRIPDGFRQGTEISNRIPDRFRQGTERFMPLPDGFRQGTEPSLSIPNGFRQGTEPTNPKAYREVAQTLNTLPEGFRQGTEPSNRIPDGFRQGTERFMPLPNGFRQGTEPSLSIPNGFRQGTEPTNPKAYREVAQTLNTLPEGFRQGTEPSSRIPDGFRQGTEPTNPLDHRDVALSFKAGPAEQANQIVEGFRSGARPFMPVQDGDRQAIQPSNHIQANFHHVIEILKSRQEPNTARCNGEIINRRCYAFNPTPMPFLEAQDSCKSLHPKAELASVTDEDLHSRLVSLVTKGGQRDRVMTWLGGMVKNQRGSWLDGSEWRYSDWMPGQPNIHTNKPVCVEMFRLDETWWTAADCDLKRASICSYPVVA